jgi:fatty acid desaturase
MTPPIPVAAPRRASHTVISARLVLESAGVFAGLLLAAGWTFHQLEGPLRWPVLLVLAAAQGLWLDRLYVTSHEAIHRKLFPGRARLNDWTGAVLMLPLMAPFTVYRRVHAFHHGVNRRDPESAALDHFRAKASCSPLHRAWYRAVWLFYVFGGGFYLHSVATVALFLLAPNPWAERISPVFANRPPALRARAGLEFATGAALHAAVMMIWGVQAWIALLGLPLLVFAWVWSLLLYIYHYRADVGPDVRRNVRSLPRQPFFSWLLLNFNEHATHHHDPRLPWYALPQHRVPSPPEPSGEPVRSLWQAIWRQRRGPVFWTPDGA